MDITFKNPSPSAGFEPANLGSNGKHATTRPPRATRINLCLSKFFSELIVFLIPGAFLANVITFHMHTE
jgi:hypothetical protein